MNYNLKKRAAALGLSFVMATGSNYGIPLPDTITTIAAAKSNNSYKVNSYGILTSYSGGSNVHIRANVSALDASVFDKVKVASFSVSSNNQYFKAVDGVLYTKDGKKLVRYPSARKGAFTVPDTVTSIAQNAFRGCSSITSIQIPESVSIIGSAAFYKCSKLESITIPSKITALRKDMFYHCRSLKNITFPSKLEILGESVFEGCYNLQNVTLPSSLKKLKAGAFRGCKSLKSISIPNKIKSIASSCFRNCTALETIHFGSGIETISNYAFAHCNSLKELSIPGTIDTIGDNAFRQCKNLKELTIHNGVSTIGYRSFMGCTSLKMVKIPNSVNSVSSYAFYNCTNLEEAVLSNQLKAINYSTFKNCVNLKSINLPSSITRIYDNAFTNCTSFTVIKIPKNVSSIASNAFNNAGTAFSVDSSNQSFASEDGVLYNAEKTTLYKFPAYKSGNYKTLDTITKISSYAFRKCQKLDKVTIGEGIKKINKSAFHNSSIKELSLPSTLKTIESSNNEINAFDLVKITISDSNNYFCSESGILYSKDKSILCMYPAGKTGTVTFPKEASDLSNISLKNRASKFAVASGSAVYTTDDGILTTKGKTKIYAVPSAKTSYNMGSKIKNIDKLEDAKPYMNQFQKFTVDNKNEKFSAKDGILFNKEQTKVMFYPNAKSGSYHTPSSVSQIDTNAFSNANKLTKLIIGKNVSKCTINLYNCTALKNITVEEGALRNLIISYDNTTTLKKLTLPTSLISGKIYNYKRRTLSDLTIVGWTNTTAEKLAKEIGAKFVSTGIVPKQVKNVKIKSYVNLKRVKISWKRDPEVSGYEIYSENKKLKDISNNNITETDLYVGDNYNSITLYIRAYKIQNGKKVYGKSKKIVYRPYS